MSTDNPGSHTASISGMLTHWFDADGVQGTHPRWAILCVEHGCPEWNSESGMTVSLLCPLYTWSIGHRDLVLVAASCDLSCHKEYIWPCCCCTCGFPWSSNGTWSLSFGVCQSIRWQNHASETSFYPAHQKKGKSNPFYNRRKAARWFPVPMVGINFLWDYYPGSRNSTTCVHTGTTKSGRGRGIPIHSVSHEITIQTAVTVKDCISTLQFSHHCKICKRSKLSHFLRGRFVGPHSHKTHNVTRNATQRKQMGPAVVNGSVHTASKQHQRICIPIFMRVGSCILCELGLEGQTLYSLWFHRARWPPSTLHGLLGDYIW